MCYHGRSLDLIIFLCSSFIYHYHISEANRTMHVRHNKILILLTSAFINYATSYDDMHFLDYRESQQKWVDSYGDGCNWYAEHDPECTLFADCCTNNGLTARMACPQCYEKEATGNVHSSRGKGSKGKGDEPPYVTNDSMKMSRNNRESK